jgi:hypothetical protein
MSTGLTYIYILDVNGANPQMSSSPVVFNDYNEAQNYCEWFMRVESNRGYEFVEMLVWTASPNNNGFWIFSGGEPVFNIYD